MMMPIIASDRVFARLNEIAAGYKIAESTQLRVEILGGGCSGFSYQFSLAGEREPGDLVITDGQNTFLVDEASLPLLSGARIDYEEGLVGARFVIDNPDAVSSCGCGTSFAI